MAAERKCFVPACENTSISAPEKKFLIVPVEISRRKLWCDAVGITLTESHRLYCCEDHFKLNEDAENWMYYTTIGNKLVLKKHVVPHLNLQGENVDVTQLQISSSTKKRKLDLKKKMAESRRLISRQLFESEPSTSFRTPSKPALSDVGQEVSLTEYFNIEEIKQTVDASMQVRVKEKNASTQTGRVAVKRSGLSSLSSSSTSDSSVPDTSDYSPFKSGTKSNGYAAQHTSSIETTISLLERNSRFYLGLPQECYKLMSILTNTCHLPYCDILIILKNLHLNDPFVRLGLDFYLSSSKVGKIFSVGIPKLAGELQDLIFWPKLDDIIKLLLFRNRNRKPTDTIKQ